MRINVHAHVFNLQTVLTDEAVNIMLGRLRGRGFPDFIVDAAGKFLKEQLLRPEYLVEEDLLRRFVEAIGESPSFKTFASGSDLPVDIRILGEGATGLAVETLRSVLDRLSTMIGAKDVTGSSVFDLYETLRLAMQPEVVDVADRLLAQMRPDDALVALMMDIVSENERPRDRKNFLAQIRGTAEAALQRPGRILPFIAVNPIRPDHFAIMKRAIEELGFLGVKLYPGLGYEVGTPAIGKVLDYCNEHDVPVTVHCTSGGFAKSQATAQFSHPKHWRDLFTGRESMRVCFAHCGGWAGLSNQDPAQREWSDEILSFMDEFPHVYADLSYHVVMMTGGVPEQRYLAALRELLAKPVLGERILFGTDSWLLRLNLTEDSFWRYFESHLTPAEFAQIAEKSPRRYLGLPDDDGQGARPNILNHLAFLKRNRTRVGDAPLAWVLKASPGVTFTPVRVNPRWSPNNRAHVLTFKYFRFEAKEIPSQFHAGGFAAAGKLRLRQLTFFRKDHEDAAFFDQRRFADAVNLDVFLRANGGSYEGDLDRDGAVQRIADLLALGGRTLEDAAAAVDALYLFPSEVE